MTMRELSKILANLILMPCVAVSISGAGPAPLPVQKSENRASTTASHTTMTADGRIQTGDGSFSMMTPAGWVVRNDVPGISMVFESPAGQKHQYRSTIQVKIASGARYLDSLGINEFQEEIAAKLGRDNGTVRDFSIRNAELVKTDDGRDALLVYSGFNLNGVDLLQAHLMMSSATEHVVITFTDIADNFNSNAADAPLGVAWTAMTSAQLAGQTPERFAGPIQLAALAGILIVVIAVLVTVRNALARQAYARVARDADGNGDAGPKSGFDAPVSGITGQGSLQVSQEDLLESATPESLTPRKVA